MNVLTFGFYNKKNLGDELFKLAFKNLFPNFTFTFVDEIRLETLKGADAVFIGGGSFLLSELRLSAECMNLLKTKPIFYVGVGVETDIHPIHAELMKIAKLIAIRTPIGFDKVKSLNTNTIIIPDLVYSVSLDRYNQKKRENSVLILPNIYVVPNNKSEHWVHNSWEHFKFEFSQFVDYLIDEEYSVHFAGMCKNFKENDDWASIEILNAMAHKNSNLIVNENLLDIIGNYDIIITQRFHGIILAEIARIKYMAIHHHDKLKNSYLNEGIFTSFYGSSKDDYINKFNLTKQLKINSVLPIERNSFDSLVKEINALLQ